MNLTGLDPYSRNFLATLGQALIAIASGQLVPAGENGNSEPTLDSLRAKLRQDDGPHFAARRVYRYVAPQKKNALDGITPAGHRVIKALLKKPQQSSRELAESTGLQRNTVDNILGQLRRKSLLKTTNAL